MNRKAIRRIKECLLSESLIFFGYFFNLVRSLNNKRILLSACWFTSCCARGNERLKCQLDNAKHNSALNFLETAFAGKYTTLFHLLNREPPKFFACERSHWNQYSQNNKFVKPSSTIAHMYLHQYEEKKIDLFVPFLEPRFTRIQRLSGEVKCEWDHH